MRLRVTERGVLRTAAAVLLLFAGLGAFITLACLREWAVMGLLAADGVETEARETGISFSEGPEPYSHDYQWYLWYSYAAGRRVFENRVEIDEDDARRKPVIVRYSRRFPSVSRPPHARDQRPPTLALMTLLGVLFTAFPLGTVLILLNSPRGQPSAAGAR